MFRPGLYYFVLFFLVLPLIWVQHTGCWKEYSRVGIDSTQLPDSILPIPVGEFPNCPLCDVSDAPDLGQWNFKTGNDYLCGITDNAGFIGNYNSNRTFTFFGPSACSVDTGIVMTVYLPATFNEDKFNITASSAAFYYYDHFGTKDIFISRSGQPFSVKIQSYINATRIVTGTFGGTVFRANGDTALIREGKFKVKLR